MIADDQLALGLDVGPVIRAPVVTLVPEDSVGVTNWLPRSRSAIADAFDDDADLFCRLLAATSPISTVETNVVNAVKAYRVIKWTGKIPHHGFIGVHRVCMRKILSGDLTELGRKVYSLYQNLAGNEEVCPIDRWMLRYFGYKPEMYVGPALYDKLEQRIRDEARLRGITPAQRQVQLWCAQRGDPTSYGDVIRRMGLQRVNLLRRLL